MKAGRDLDALIAEKAMGWTKRVSADHTQSSIRAFRSFGVIYAWRDKNRREMGLDVPLYSTDIAAAWEVVEHLRSQGIAVTISTMGPRVNTSAHITYADGRRSERLHWGNSGPHAICLAALEAVGVEVEETPS